MIGLTYIILSRENREAMERLFRRTVIDELNKYLSTDEIVVLHGARQVGKTSILHLLQDELRSRREATYFIDLEDSRYVRILDEGVDAFLDTSEKRGSHPLPPNQSFLSSSMKFNILLTLHLS